MNGKDDVLENGPRRSRRGVTAVLAAVGVIALVLVLALRLGEDQKSAPTPSGTPWPTAWGACHNGVETPLVSASPLTEDTGMRVLTGGARLTLADVDTGSTQPRGKLDGRWFQQLVQRGDDMYAVALPCGEGTATVVRLDEHVAARPVTFSGPIDDLIGGDAGLWGVQRQPDEDGRIVLRGLDGRDLELPREVLPVGVTRAGIVAVRPSQGDDPGHAVVVIDPRSGKVVRNVTEGGSRDLRGVGGNAVLWTGHDCRFRPGEDSTPVPRRPCALHYTPLTAGAETVVHQLPDNRIPASDPVFSRDGTKVAFQLSRPRHELHFADRHPWTPSEVVVLDVDTGRLTTMPGLILPAKTTAGLAFSPDGRRLVVTTNDGDEGRLFVWTVGAKRLYRSQVPIAGPLNGSVPVLVVG